VTYLVYLCRIHDLMIHRGSMSRPAFEPSFTPGRSFVQRYVFIHEV